MSELLEAVDDLTLPRNVKVQTDDGTAWAQEDALLVQLQEAVTSTLSSGSGAGGSAWTRNVLDSDALYRAGIISSQIGDWCRMVGVRATRDMVKDLRAWYVHRLSATNPDDFYVRKLREWAGMIRTMVNPPKTIEIDAKCPVCDQGTYVNDLGERVTRPLVWMYRPGDANMHQSARAICRACEAVWEGAAAMGELSDELDERSA